MASNPKREDFTINTIVGTGTTFKGDISSAGFVRVDGNIHGDVTALGRVVIGEKARLQSDVVGTTVIVGGAVKGNIYASEAVTVLSTGLVIGDIVTRRIQADDGVFLQGRVIVCGEEGDFQTRLDSYRDERGVRARAAPQHPRPDAGNA